MGGGGRTARALVGTCRASAGVVSPGPRLLRTAGNEQQGQEQQRQDTHGTHGTDHGCHPAARVFPSGAPSQMISTVRDVNTFLSKLLAGELLPPAQQRQLLDAVHVDGDKGHGGPQDRYGLGIRHFKLKEGCRVWGHGGRPARHDHEPQRRPGRAATGGRGRRDRVLRALTAPACLYAVFTS
ncbi:serine hydrolase [Streptomyces sp. NPDC050982]|uniref:serine hydrolase n=1 Tax=Streptomyces sp. NPDC050982 TaxID=3154746 RepID=UPI0033DEA659